jgi:hypothetical protein
VFGAQAGTCGATIADGAEDVADTDDVNDADGDNKNA